MAENTFIEFLKKKFSNSNNTSTSILDSICHQLQLKDILCLLRTCKDIYKTLLDQPREGIHGTTCIFLVLGRKCQFCKKIPPGKNSIKIYSAWNVRSCRKCIESRFSSVPPPCELPYEELLVDKTPLSKYNKKFENCKFYLKSDVDSARNEYNALLPEKRDEWRTKKSNAYQRKLRDILLRKDKIREYKGYQAEYEKGAQDHRLKLLTSKCKEMENENNPYTGEKFNFIILQKCQAYKDACKSKEEMTDRRWGYLRKKLIEQHSDFISNKK
ncbi:hypothetical protein RhiirA5_429020 [Rhizophagus irregularis]|uniref:F-box domain-containing protein n=1 Tax=Rhizophagus irregularis TaxID=588596 RepID=A0A2I1F3U0_9GLOM|nr:hypothetical protein RhiirA5_429020 [Rhizophagus irregularis]PKC60348.1 hypothetical protein RhiirA1_444964 [Rhizophagus irregularis]PKY29036.1 hypothetical protein RhiirB3_445485 [Rhizophagus irregularis]